jgi:hypothetical protein
MIGNGWVRAMTGDRVWFDVKRRGPRSWSWSVWNGARIVKSGRCFSHGLAFVIGGLVAARVRAMVFALVPR